MVIGQKINELTSAKAKCLWVTALLHRHDCPGEKYLDAFLFWAKYQGKHIFLHLMFKPMIYNPSQDPDSSLGLGVMGAQAWCCLDRTSTSRAFGPSPRKQGPAPATPNLAAVQVTTTGELLKLALQKKLQYINLLQIFISAHVPEGSSQHAFHFGVLWICGMCLKFIWVFLPVVLAYIFSSSQ